MLVLLMGGELATGTNVVIGHSSDPRGWVAAHIRGVHHIGIPVRSIERSLAWYGKLFGFTPDFIQVAEGPETSQTVQLENARLRFAFMRVGNTIVEFLEYERPVGQDFDRRNCDVGAIHVCLEVDDIERVHRVLTERGVEFSIGPTRLDGAVEGQLCCYFRDPDGIQLELWQRAEVAGGDDSQPGDKEKRGA
jgi:catechol 2,3-dioxygenase-like lactoylglutathione lyase family enzyme